MLCHVPFVPVDRCPPDTCLSWVLLRMVTRSTMLLGARFLGGQAKQSVKLQPPAIRAAFGHRDNFDVDRGPPDERAKQFAQIMFSCVSFCFV